MKVFQHILFLFLLPLYFSGMGQSHPFHQYGLTEGFPDLKVYDAAQDSLGYMWFATESGLCRLDAFHLEVFTVGHGLAHNQLREIFIDQNNSSWLLSIGSVTRYRNQEFQILDSIPYLGPDRILSISEDQRGGMWLTTLRNLHFYADSLPTQKYRLSDLGLNHGARLLGRDPQGLICLADDENAFRFDPDFETQKLFPFRYAAKEKQVGHWLDKHGNLWSAFEAGLTKMDPTGKQELVLPAAKMPGWKGASSFLLDQNQNIWIGGAEGGLFWIDQVEGEYRLLTQFLPGTHCLDIFQDREQNYWISTEGQGIFQLSVGAAAVIRQNLIQFRGLRNLGKNRSDRLVDIELDPNQHLWLAWEEGALERVEVLAGDRLKSQIYDLRTIFGKKTTILQILALQEGDVLVATNQGLAMGNRQGFQKIEGLDDVYSLSQVASGEIFIGTESFIGFRMSHETLRQRLNSEGSFPIQSSNRFNGFRTCKVNQDEDGNLWVAWLGGLNRVDPLGKVTDFKLVNPIFRAGISDIDMGWDGSRWFATQGSGLAILPADDTPPILLNRKSGLRSEVIHQVLMDKRDSAVWLATPDGLGKIEPDYWRGKPLEILWLDRKEGLPSNQVIDLLPYDSLLLVLTPEGLTFLENEPDRDKKTAPPVFLTGLRVGETSYDYAQKHTLPSDSNSITVNFSALGFRHPGKMGFQYQLQGGDNSWKETNKTELHFSNLSPGEYSLFILAMDRDRLLSEVPARLDFTIKPPFYRTLWFNSLLGILILILAVFFSHYLSNKRRKEWLEEKVSEKTIALQNKVYELGVANEDLRQFAYVASHDLKTPLRTIINHLQLLERRYKGQLDDRADEFISFAVNSSKQLYQMINDLLIYSELGQKEAKSESFSLIEILDKVRGTLQGYLIERNAVLISGPLPDIFGVRTEWELLLRNLVENGIKFNYDPNPEIRIECKDSPGFWILSVSDNGIGIPKDYQQNIFQIFQRLHTVEFSGNGLGLAMCKRIVEMRGGNIWLESEPGQGTHVFFSVPKEPIKERQG